MDRLTAQRLVAKLLAYPRIVDKNKDALGQIDRKEKELQKEIDTVRKQLESNEKRAKELSALISEDLSRHFKGIVNITQ